LLHQLELQLEELVADAAENRMQVERKTTKINGIEPQIWLADVIARNSDMPVSRLQKLLPWHWTPTDKSESSVKTA
jgi:hypothetical protein